MYIDKHSKYIYEYVNAVPDEICDEIINLVETNIHRVRETSLSNRNRFKDNTSVHLTSDPLFRRVDELSHEYISKSHQKFIRDNPIINFFISERGHIDSLHSDYFYRHYGVKDSYDWHSDYSGNRCNILSYIIYLNDDFEGGDLLFLNGKERVTPKKGSIVCFPCDMYHIHKSSPIISGSKKIIWSCLHKIVN